MPSFLVTLPAVEGVAAERSFTVDAKEWTDAVFAALESDGSASRVRSLDLVGGDTVKTALAAPLGWKVTVEKKGDATPAEIGAAGTMRLAGNALDIASLKRTTHVQKPLKRSAQKFDDGGLAESLMDALFFRLGDMLSSARSTQKLAGAALDFVERYFDAESSALLFFDDRSKDFYFADARGPKASDVMKLRVPGNEGIVGLTLRSDRAIVVQDAAKSPHFHPEVAAETDYPVRAMVSVPVSHQGRTWGCVQVMNPRGGTFDGDQVRGLAYLGREVGRALDRLWDLQGTLKINRPLEKKP